MALVSMSCAVNAGEIQESWCGDESLSYCIKHFDRQCSAKNYTACWRLWDFYTMSKSSIAKLKNTMN